MWSAATWVAGTLIAEHRGDGEHADRQHQHALAAGQRRRRERRGTAAANAMMPDRNDRRELASTSSSSDRTTVGTMADLATW